MIYNTPSGESSHLRIWKVDTVNNIIQFNESDPYEEGKRYYYIFPNDETLVLTYWEPGSLSFTYKKS